MEKREAQMPAKEAQVPAEEALVPAKEALVPSEVPSEEAPVAKLTMPEADRVEFKSKTDPVEFK